MAAAKVQVGTSTITGTSCSVTLTGVVQNNWIVLVVQQAAAAVRTATASGFTQQEAVNSGTTNQQLIFYKQETGATGDQTYTVTMNNSTTYRVTAYEVSGANASPISTSGNNTEASSTSHNVFSAGLTIPSDGLLIACGSPQTALSWNTLTYSSVTLDVNTTLGGCSQFVASWAPGSTQSGYTGAFTVGIARSTFSAGVVIAGASAGGTVAGPVIGHLAGLIGPAKSFGGRVLV